MSMFNSSEHSTHHTHHSRITKAMSCISWICNSNLACMYCGWKESRAKHILYHTDDTRHTYAMGTQTIQCSQLAARHHLLDDVFYWKPQVRIIAFHFLNRLYAPMESICRRKWKMKISHGSRKSAQMNPFKYFMNNNNLIKLTYYCRSHAFNHILPRATEWRKKLFIFPRIRAERGKKKKGKKEKWMCWVSARCRKNHEVAGKLHEMHQCHRWDSKLILYLVGVRKPSHGTWSCDAHEQISSTFIHLRHSRSLLLFHRFIHFNSSALLACIWIWSLCGEQISGTHASVWQIIRDNKHWSIQSAFGDGLFQIFFRKC